MNIVYSESNTLESQYITLKDIDCIKNPKNLLKWDNIKDTIGFIVPSSIFYF